MKIFYEEMFRRAGTEFLIGWKCLTEKGKARIGRVLKWGKRLKGKIKDLECIAYLNDVLVGLECFFNGTEGGFERFGKLGTIDKLACIVLNKGKVEKAYEEWCRNREL